MTWDKDAVFGEAYRVLRPGGRMSVSDVVIHGELPQSIRDNLDAWAGCLAGALKESDYLAKIRAAGFEQVQVLSRDYAEVGEAAGSDDGQAQLGEAADCGPPRAIVPGVRWTGMFSARLALYILAEIC